MRPNPVLKKLGFDENDCLVVIHVDDVGMCQASVAAFEDLYGFGLVSSGAVMVPCPWFLEAARLPQKIPGVDLGVHLTLTSEWESYRWGPVSTRDPASGLLDAQGFFYRTTAEVQEFGDPEAVQVELNAQMQRAVAAGIHPTHADTHMGAVVHMKFIQAYLQLALEYQMPPMMLRLDEAGWRAINSEHSGAALDADAIALAVQMVDTLEEMGIPLLDAIRHLHLDSNPAERMRLAKEIFSALQPGVTHFIIHAAKDTPELRAIAPDWECRVADYHTFMQEELREHIQNIGIQVIGYRDLQELMRASNP
ncbi:MAG: polysaccharide deacetylase family protein [Anaerolineales bacterium]|jgi:hypothetical protein